jgi:hypothetical protein
MSSQVWEDMITAHKNNVEQLAEDAHFRDVELTNWGFLSFDDASGAGAFMWFADRATLLDFLGTQLVFLDAPSAQTAFTLSQVTQAIIANLQHGFFDETTTIERLNVALKQMVEIRWIGSFASLCNENTPFTRSIRAWYYDRCDIDDIDFDEPYASRVEPIPPDERSEFAEAIQEYGM